jgi:hypothetical protein
MLQLVVEDNHANNRATLRIGAAQAPENLNATRGTAGRLPAGDASLAPGPGTKQDLQVLPYFRREPGERLQKLIGADAAGDKRLNVDSA